MAERRGIGSIRWLSKNKCLLRISAGFDDFGNRIQPTKTVEAKNEREAERKLYDFYSEREKLREEKITRAPETLGELYKEWIGSHVKISLREKTKEYYENVWDNHLAKYRNSKLSTFNPRMVRKIIDDSKPIPRFKKDGKPRKSNVKTGDRLRKSVFGMLKSMFNWAKKQPRPYMRDNPCDYVDPPVYNAVEKGVFTEENIADIIELVSKESYKYQAIFYFAALCGLRRGEIVGLKWDDIDFDIMTFSVDESATRLKGKGTTEGDTKTKKSVRTLALPETLVPILHNLHAEQTEKKLKLGEKWIDGNYVFTQWNGKLMCVDTPTTWWTKMRKKHTEFPEDKSLHTLRHTIATYMIKEKVPISDVSGVLGHARQSTTLNIYCEVIKDTKKTALSTYENHVKKIQEKVSAKKKKVSV